MNEKVYANLEEAQAALDAGQRVRIAVKPYLIDPTLVQRALDLQAQEQLKAWKRREQQSSEEEVLHAD